MPADANPENLTSLAQRAHRDGEWWCYWRAPGQAAVLGVGIGSRAQAGSVSELEDPRGFVTVAFDGVADGAWSAFSALEVIEPAELHRGELDLSADGPQPARDFAPGEYPDAVRAALRSIDAGLVQKIVVAREETVAAADPVATLGALQHAFSNCYVFAVGTREALFLGATPERLVEVSGTEIETSALAGTSKPGDASLLESDKDLREHRWVVEAIESALRPSCETLDVPTEPELLELPNVQHLHTPIRGTLKSKSDWPAVVDRLHPTPAVCGEPRAEARRLIREIEGFDRGLYAGVVGWVDGERADLAVALRSALFLPDETRLYAGAGIVEGSDPDAEHRETVSKLQAVARWLRTR